MPTLGTDGAATPDPNLDIAVAKIYEGMAEVRPPAEQVVLLVLAGSIRAGGKWPAELSKHCAAFSEKFLRETS